MWLLVVASALARALTAGPAAAGALQHLQCVTIPGELDEPVTIWSPVPMAVEWSSKPVVENSVTAQVCGTTLPEVALNSRGALVISHHPTVDGDSATTTVRLAAPWNRLPALRSSASYQMPGYAPVEERVTACSDGIDNDGDGAYRQPCTADDRQLVAPISCLPGRSCLYRS
jgi:hypothetical protein